MTIICIHRLVPLSPMIFFQIGFPLRNEGIWLIKIAHLNSRFWASWASLAVDYVMMSSFLISRKMLSWMKGQMCGRSSYFLTTPTYNIHNRLALYEGIVIYTGKPWQQGVLRVGGWKGVSLRIILLFKTAPQGSHFSFFLIDQNFYFYLE